MPIEAWYMCEPGEAGYTDQRQEARRSPNVPVSRAALEALGVLSWEGMDADNVATDPALASVRAARGYSYSDVISISPEKLPNYEAKIKSFFEEHLHTDEEIRYVLDGSGFFDIKDAADAWIRIAMSKGDMIVLPAGLYHRFTLDERNFIQAMRLFVGEPVWTAYNRSSEGTDAMPARTAFLKNLAAISS